MLGGGGGGGEVEVRVAAGEAAGKAKAPGKAAASKGVRATATAATIHALLTNLVVHPPLLRICTREDTHQALVRGHAGASDAILQSDSPHTQGAV